MTTTPARQVSQDRADYLREMCALLWPPPASATIASRGRSEASASRAGRELIVLPRATQPRLVVPTERRAGAAAVRRYGEPGSLRSRLATRALSAVLASGAGGAMLRDRLITDVPAGAQTIESYLAGVLGRPVRVSMHLGAARANRKPVLQLLEPGGEAAGFAKIGVSPLTSALVRSEHSALERLSQSGLSRLRAPRPLHLGTWRGLDVLVLSPLPVWSRRVRLRSGALESAMAELAGVAGIYRAPLAESEYWQRLTARLDEAGTGPEHDALRAALGRLAASSGTTVLGFGACHGDWTPWNMASTRGGLLVWDWERFSAGVPVGFDALHCWLQAQVSGRRRDPRQKATACVSRAPELLAPFGVTPGQARAVALAYLADLAVRYLSDRQEQAGARLGAPRVWLLPALDAGLDGR